MIEERWDSKQARDRLMKLGQFTISTVSGGRFRSDGGTMFGVVPKALWSKLIAVDEDNCIPQATNCVLVQTGQQNILIDTGYGSKLRDKERGVCCGRSGRSDRRQASKPRG